MMTFQDLEKAKLTEPKPYTLFSHPGDARPDRLERR